MVVLRAKCRQEQDCYLPALTTYSHNQMSEKLLQHDMLQTRDRNEYGIGCMSHAFFFLPIFRILDQEARKPAVETTGSSHDFPGVAKTRDCARSSRGARKPSNTLHVADTTPPKALPKLEHRPINKKVGGNSIEICQARPFLRVSFFFF